MNIERIKEELARTYVKIEKLQKKARDLEEQKKQAEDISNTVLCGRCSASARRATVIRRGKK